MTNTVLICSRNAHLPVTVVNRLRVTGLGMLFAAMMSGAAVALPEDCLQSKYPYRVIAGCTEVLRREPGNAVPYFRRGSAHLKSRNIGSAIADLTKAIEIDPRYAEAYSWRGSALEQTRDFAGAIADQTKAIEFDPMLPRAYNGRGHLYQLQRDHDRAIADFSKAIELDPSSTFGYLHRALSYGFKNDTERAIADLNQALRLSGNDDGLFSSLNPTEYNQLLTLLGQRIEGNAADAAAYYDRGRAYAAFGDWNRAIRDYDRAIELDPTHAEAHIRRGAVYSSIPGGEERALADFNRAVEIDPRNPRAYSQRASAYLASFQDEGRALADLSQAIELDPMIAEAYFKRGVIYALNNSHADAKAEFAKAIELNWQAALWIKGLYPDYLNEIETERQTRAR